MTDTVDLKRAQFTSASGPLGGHKNRQRVIGDRISELLHLKSNYRGGHVCLTKLNTPKQVNNTPVYTVHM